MTHADTRPVVVSLFSGAGGLDIGLEQAGFRTNVVMDSDSTCVETLKRSQAAQIPSLNTHVYLEGTSIIKADIGDVTPTDLWPHSAMPGPPDLVVGGPPCQPFSSSGKMLALQDPRGPLFQHFVRLVADLKPRLVLFENVRGLVTAKGPSGKPGEVLLLIKEAFEGVGYGTSFGLLNSADFGSYQRRVRLFMLGARDTDIPFFPTPSHGEDYGPTLFHEVQPWKTLGEFLHTHPTLNSGDLISPSPRLVQLLADVASGSGLKSPGPRETTRPGGHWGYKQGTFIADLTKPARTITAAASQDWIRSSDKSLRRLTDGECAALQGFPPEWQFAGGLTDRFRQIGNAVPVTFGYVLGLQMVKALIGPASGQPSSVALPADILRNIACTEREEKTNGAIRRSIREMKAKKIDELKSIKGLGSDDWKW